MRDNIKTIHKFVRLTDNEAGLLLDWLDDTCQQWPDHEALAMLYKALNYDDSVTIKLKPIT